MKEAPDLIDKTGLETLEVIARATRFNEWMYNQIRPDLQGRILEIGSGIGNISGFLVRDGYDITLSDLDAFYLESLQKKFSGKNNVRDILSIDLADPDFENSYLALQGSFDSVFLLNVLEHIEKDADALRHIHFLLKKGGTLVVLTPAYQWLYCRYDKELGHFRRYTKKRLSQLISQNGYALEKARYFNLLGIAGWFVLGKLAGKRNLESGELSLFDRLVPLAKWLDRICFSRAGLSVIVTGRK